jgi:gas vesicle protein
VAMEVWMAAKEQSSKELRGMKTEVEQFEGALEQLGKQYEQLQRKVCLLLEVFLMMFNVQYI